MKNPGMYIRHPKARGEWAELRFMTRATELGFIVTKPWGDMAPFDLALAHRGHFVRVQVKCTIFQRGNSYKCHLDSNGLPYRPDQIRRWVHREFCHSDQREEPAVCQRPGAPSLSRPLREAGKFRRHHR